MPKPNYSFEKRKREMAQQQKREQKRLKKLERKMAKGGDQVAETPAPEAPPAG